MASTEEELALAWQAKTAIEGKPTTEAIEVLRKAHRIPQCASLPGRYRGGRIGQPQARLDTLRAWG